ILIDGCEISSGGDAAVFVSGTGSAPRFRSCRLTGPGKHGILLADGSAHLDGCEIIGSAMAGAEVRPGSRLRIERCDITGNGGDGIAAAASSLIEATGSHFGVNGRAAIAAGVNATVRVNDCTFAAPEGMQIVAAPLATILVDGKPR
ncbi:MAG: right-handed parallel beta-helix repeat-containing protein, partial [Thermomicrobiales bacterium]